MSFDQLVMRCAAPALCGIKSASLFSMRLDLYGRECGKLAEWNSCFASQGIFIVPLKQKDSRVLFFVYNRRSLETLFADEAVRLYLEGKGYRTSDGLDAVLAELFLRLASCDSFPHEVGVFLGYPLEDVCAFERTSGTGFKYSGCWKVYGDIDSAVRRMDMYKRCSAFCTGLLACGCSVPVAVQRYRRAN